MVSSRKASQLIRKVQFPGRRTLPWARTPERPDPCPPRILFLDFDGVLHPGSGVDSGFLCRAPDLEEALSGHDLRIVVSSSWRFHMELDEILGMLPPGLAQRVVGATGEAHIGRWPRFHEIRAWMQAQEPLANWRALDDATLEFPRPCPELIACDPRTGFGVEQAGELRRWLRAAA